VDLSVAELGYELDEAFAVNPIGAWLMANCYRFGFVLSYPRGFEDVTGYAFEPWHFRFVGRPLAELIVVSGRAPVELLAERWALLTGERRVTGAPLPSDR
jgi:D-alanyl-D-alanine carboxypeptidase